MSVANLHSSTSINKRHPSAYQERLIDWNSQSGVISNERLYPQNPSIYSAVHVRPVQSSQSPYHSQCLQCSSSYLNEGSDRSGNNLTVPHSHSEHSVLKVIGTCKISDGKSGSRFCNAETNTESVTPENGKTGSTLKVPCPEKQEYPALTKFFHRKFMKGHSVESDRVNPMENDVAFNAQMPEQMKCSSVTCGIVLDPENSSVSSVMSSGDCNDSVSPCCKNQCCSPSSTVTSDSSDPSANCKTDSKCQYSSSPLHLKVTNGRNETADQKFCTKYSFRRNENMAEVKDIDDVLLGNLNTGSAYEMQDKLENIENIENGGSSEQQVMSMLNLDLSTLLEHPSNDSKSDIKQSKCWKSPEEVRLGYGRVAALAKHFSRLGDSGLIRVRGREGLRGRTGPGNWGRVFKSLPDVSRMCLKNERKWDCPKPGPQASPPSPLHNTNSNPCSHVYAVGLGSVSYSMNHLLFGDSSEDLGVQYHYKSCEELNLQDNTEFEMAGSGDKEFKKVSRQFKNKKGTQMLEDSFYSGHARSEDNVQVLTEIDSKESQLHCTGVKHRAFIILASGGMPVNHSKSEGSIISAVHCVGDSKNFPLFVVERPRSEDNMLKAGLSDGDKPSWDQQRNVRTETENHLGSCFKSEIAVLPSQMKFCKLMDYGPKSKSNILLSAYSQDRLCVVPDGNGTRRNSEPPSASSNCINKQPAHNGYGFPTHSRCKQ